MTENLMDAQQNEVESETLISPEQESVVPPIQPNEIIVTNSDQGNTVAGRLIASLLNRIDTFDQHLISECQRVNICETQLQSIRHDLALLRKELQAAALSQKEEFEERLQAADQNLQKKIKKFESLEKKLTNIETSTKQYHDDQDSINSQINDKITKLENETQSSFSDLQCQVSQLITRIDETDIKLGQLNKQFETRNDEIMQTMLANGKKDIHELSEKLKASQVEVDELKQNLSDLQGQLNQSIEEMKKDMAELSKVHPVNDAPPSGNQPQPAFNETMDTLRRKLDHLTDSLIPKEASQKRRSIMQSHRNETRQNYRHRTQSLLLESSLSETMDSPVLQRSHSTSSTGSSGRGTLPHQQSGESLPAIGEQNISSSLTNPSTELSPIGTNESSQMKRQISIPPQLVSQQSNENSSETHHNIVEVLWAMGDLVDHLKNLAGNYVDNTSTSDSDPGLVLTSTDNDTNNGIGGTP